jgi:flagellar motor protein MotB
MKSSLVATTLVAALSLAGGDALAKPKKAHTSEDAKDEHGKSTREKSAHDKSSREKKKHDKHAERDKHDKREKHAGKGDAKVESSKSDAKVESSKSDAKSDSAKSDSAKSDSAKSDSSKTDGPKADASYFLGSVPHVPLVVVRGSSFAATSTKHHPCGDPKRWANKGSRWKALDAWGQLAGEVEVASSELYDVTTCNELSLRTVSGSEGAKVYVSADSPFTPSKSAEATPTKEERDALEAMARAVNEQWLDKDELAASQKAPVSARFFSMPEHQSDGTTKPVLWAVVDGFALMTAHRVDGRWTMMTMKGPRRDSGQAVPDRYRVRSIFDMNGDGRPEIVLHFDGLDGFEDVVLSFDGSNDFCEVSDSRGGSTA